MTKPLIATDVRRFAHAVDRLDAVSATDREAAARHVFEVCVYHVTRVRKTHPPPSNGQAAVQTPPAATLIFDIVHPHIYRIARRLDRAMRHAERSPHPADAAALIVAVDAQGALAALFAVAQNAGVAPTQLELLALPLRKRSAPALLRTLFSPDMRVANAAKKALRQIAAIASCQNTPWMGTIRAALALRSGARVNRSTLLRNVLVRLAEILHLVVRQAAVGRGSELTRRRSSRTSLGGLFMGSRQSLNAAKRAQEREREKEIEKEKNGWKGWLWGLKKLFVGKEEKREFEFAKSVTESDIDAASVASGGLSTVGSWGGSVVSSVGDGAAAGRKRKVGTMKRDAATAMYIFERMLSKRINPELDDRIEVIGTLADIAQTSFSGQYAVAHKIDHVQEYSDVMADVFRVHGQRIYAVVLEILFRPVREADASRFGVFSLREAGMLQARNTEGPFTRRKMAEFPQSAICLPNLDCTGLAAVSCNSLLKVFLRFVPDVCSHRMALLTGTINSAFLHSSEALQRSESGCSWEVSKIVSAVDALAVLVSVIPHSVEDALEHVVREPVTLRLVIETCIRSVSATGRLLAQNAARQSAPRLSDEGTLDSLRSWRALLRIVPSTSSWNGTPSYSSSILFLAQVARRAALISVLQGYRKDRFGIRTTDETMSEETYPSVSTLNTTHSGTTTISVDDSHGSGHSGLGVHGAGFELEDDNVLSAEFQQSVIAMINVAGTNPVDVFFELYRTLVYLYATDLNKTSAAQLKRKASSPRAMEATEVEGATITPEKRPSESSPGERSSGRIGNHGSGSRSQSDADAKGVLVENIAVDGQLPSRALRRAVMASEIDLGEFFENRQPLSLHHVTVHHPRVPPGKHTFEEFSCALAIILGTLSKHALNDVLEDPQEAAQLIARDVQRSGSVYLKRVHKRAKSILKRQSLDQHHDWRTIQYEQRIRRLEEEVASLKTLMRHTFDGGLTLTRRKSLPKILGLSGNPPVYRYPYERDHEALCNSLRCFCR